MQHTTTFFTYQKCHNVMVCKTCTIQKCTRYTLRNSTFCHCFFRVKGCLGVLENLFDGNTRRRPVRIPLSKMFYENIPEDDDNILLAELCTYIQVPSI